MLTTTPDPGGYITYRFCLEKCICWKLIRFVYFCKGIDSVVTFMPFTTKSISLAIINNIK